MTKEELVETEGPFIVESTQFELTVPVEDRKHLDLILDRFSENRHVLEYFPKRKKYDIIISHRSAIKQLCRIFNFNIMSDVNEKDIQKFKKL